MALPQHNEPHATRDSAEHKSDEAHLDAGAPPVHSDEDAWTGLREILVPEHLRAWLNQRGIFTKEEVLAHWDKGKRIAAALDDEARATLESCLQNTPVDLVESGTLYDLEVDDLASEEVTSDLDAAEMLAESLEEATTMLESASVRMDGLLDALHDQRGQLAHYTEALDQQISALNELREDVDGKLRKTLKALDRHFT